MEMIMDLTRIHQSFRDGGWLTRQRLTGYATLLLFAYILTIVTWISLADGWKDRAGNPIGADFTNVYAAGIMTYRGESGAAYDWTAHKRVESEIIGYDAPFYYAWHYPPLFLGVAFVLALLPYGWALCLYMASGMVVYIAALRPLLPKTRISLLAIGAFPGVFVNLSNGQNGFITTALLAGGLYFLETQPWLGGMLLGGLSYKPQFFFVIPCLLFCTKQWRALIATIMTVLVLVALSLLAFGVRTWFAFFASARLTQKLILEKGAAGWGKIQSLFSFLRALGFELRPAYGMQAILAVSAFFAALLISRQAATTHAIRMAAFCATVLLATPYLFDYDLTVMAVPVAFLAAQGLRDGFLPYEKSLLAIFWIWPFIARGIGMHGVVLTPFVLLALLGICYRRAMIKA